MAPLTRNLELYVAPGRAPLDASWTQSSFDEALANLKRFKGVFGWERVRLIIENPYTAGNPLKTYLALLLLAPRSAELVSADGRRKVKVNIRNMLEAAAKAARSGDVVRTSIRETLEFLEAAPDRAAPFAASRCAPFVWRTNLWFGSRVGGSYSHAAGVLNGLKAAFGDVALATTDDVHSLDPAIRVEKIELGRIEGWESGPGIHFAANRGLFEEAQRLCPKPPAFVYQRNSLGDVSGLRLARTRRRPFVIEYNGPEVWVATQWGEGLAHAAEFERVETALLRKADLVLVVSRVLIDEVVSRGVDPERVLLSPNAVDPARFNPGVAAVEMRKRLNLGDRRTAVLLSSFGPWHGVDVATAAFARLLAEKPDLKSQIALVLAGDGSGRAAAREQALNAGLVEGETVFFPGMIAADDAPALLACGEILLAPTRRNPDGSAFFGSPTKVFEYMAMGKAIVASGLDQINEILKDGESAILVEPGDAAALSGALREAFARPERLKPLGEAARRAAVAEHSWTARMQALKERLAVLEAR